jgi:hypothetical protein
VKRIEIKTLGDLIDRAMPVKADPASGRFRGTAVYRGVARDTRQLFTSLDRLGGMSPPHSKAHLEAYLLRNFMRYGQPFLRRSDSLWELMVVAEHHGLPTRLLDWTQSPLVAAHFATLQGEPRHDRLVWQLDWRSMHRSFGLPEVVFLIDDLERELKRRGIDSPWDFLNCPETSGPFACLFEPPAVTDRLAVQSGAFTLCSSKEQTLDRIIAAAGLCDALTQFVIPATRVEYVRDQLDLCTVDERRLFPGLDGIAAELKRYYSGSSDASQG